MISLWELDVIAEDPAHPLSLTLYGISDGLETTQMYGAEIRAPAARGGRALRKLLSTMATALTILLCWILFYMFGRMLMMAESAHHSFDENEQVQQ